MHRLLRIALVVLGLVVLSAPASALASHFRGASITWTRASASSQVVNFNVTHSWRCCPGMNFRYGGGSPSSQNLASNLIGSFTDSSGASYQTYNSTATHTYPGSGPYTAYFQSNARIGGMGFASNQSFRVESVVNFSGGNTASPAIGTSALLQLVRGAQNSVSMAIVDPDNGASATCGWATCSQAGVSSSQCNATGGEFRPSWLSLDTTNCVLSGTPPTGGAILWPYAVRVTDNNGAVTTFDGMIELVTGTPPTCTGGGNFNASVGQPFSTSFTGSNPAGGTITMQLASGPPGGTLSPLSGSSPLTSTFNWTPSASDFGQTYAATVIVSNSTNLQTTCPLGLTVPQNQPPVVSTTGPYQGVNGVPTPVNGSATDPDGTVATYEWDCDGDGVFEIGPQATAAATCGPITSSGTYTITLRVTDTAGGIGSTTTTITIPSLPPVANAGGPYTGNIAIPVALSGNGSSDPDGTIATYEWD
ncbi:MAG: PKD domain-containing protein, partial [Deltaproteobacteria bacterium]|nr:PKD domain-containing protein [Deltaproteobacteria bacterium]